VGFVCRSVLGEDRAEKFAPEVVGWIERNLRGYPWPGNFRELEQCVRSYTIRKEYHPPRPPRPRADDGPARPPCDPVADACKTLAGAVLDNQITYEEIRRRPFASVRLGTRTFEEAAAFAGCDVRTFQKHLS
jgi:DNA-binding NtrC family response regulator